MIIVRKVNSDGTEAFPNYYFRRDGKIKPTCIRHLDKSRTIKWLRRLCKALIWLARGISMDVQYTCTVYVFRAEVSWESASLK